ncbi:uncharacterized protein B0H18DRAFT_957472 [Fomitopsis serialis]|uniref:uncharacterized protein n=1 Tax=Fomitopsis serialis TaxID=139415 RepID=UPI0020074862|nr:uncharacterized protein B0H18DRAFT_957472 [Neoantrodia serialis]KAH9919514.1 hypothetical protein B0H18DRAFT_957472 [Neoantrodia serialis]
MQHLPTLQQEDELSDDDDDDDMQRDALLALLALGALESREGRRAHRRDHYLTRAELLPDPRIDTPWQRLWETQSDRAFITTMGVDVETFHYLLDNGFTRGWNSTAIPRSDTNPRGQPRLGRRSLDAAGALGLYLHYLGSSMTEVSLQEIFALIPGTTNRYLRFARSLMLTVLREIPEGRVAFPKDDEYNELSRLVSDDPAIENATFNGWLHDHYTSCVLVFSAQVGTMQGSRDRSISSCETKYRKDITLLQTPLFRVVLQKLQGESELHVPMARNSLTIHTSEQPHLPSIINYCRTAKLWNGACASQIRNVYEPLWKRSEAAELWDNYERMVIRDIRRGDRVARYHLGEATV